MKFIFVSILFALNAMALAQSTEVNRDLSDPLRMLRGVLSSDSIDLPGGSLRETTRLFYSDENHIVAVQVKRDSADNWGGYQISPVSQIGFGCAPGESAPCDWYRATNTYFLYPNQNIRFAELAGRAVMVSLGQFHYKLDPGSILDFREDGQVKDIRYGLLHKKIHVNVGGHSVAIKGYFSTYPNGQFKSGVLAKGMVFSAGGVNLKLKKNCCSVEFSQSGELLKGALANSTVFHVQGKDLTALWHSRVVLYPGGAPKLLVILGGVTLKKADGSDLNLFSLNKHLFYAVWFDPHGWVVDSITFKMGSDPLYPFAVDEVSGHWSVADELEYCGIDRGCKILAW